MTKGVPWTYLSVWGASVPSTMPNDTGRVVVANRVETAVEGWVVGVRFYRFNADTSLHVGMLMDDAASEVVDATVFYLRPFFSGDGGEWQTRYFRKQYHYAADSRFVVACWFQDGQYSRTSDALNGGPMVNGDLRFTEDGDGGSNGLYEYSGLIPGSSYASAAYGVDVVFRAHL